MGNSPSRNDLNSSSSNNNNGGSNPNATSSTSLLVSQDDPDPLPIQSSSNNPIFHSPLSESSSDLDSCFTSISTANSISSSSYSTNLSNSKPSFTNNLYSIEETSNNSPKFPSAESSSPSPPSSPSSINSIDLQFNLDLEKPPFGSESLSTPPPPQSLHDSKVKQPPPKNNSSLSKSPSSKLSPSNPSSSKPSSSANSSKRSKSSPLSLNVDIDSIIEKLVTLGLSKRKPPKLFDLTNDELRYICAKSRNILMSQPMLLELAAPVKIVGDIHGQFIDLLRIFKLCGFPPNSNYLFMGDYVDRGKQSLETIVLLLCLKIKYPENFFLLRGNHETAEITKIYGFYDECKRRTLNGVKTWKLFVDVFNCFPVAATIADKIFCVHGGLSPHLKDLNQIKKIQRPTDIPDEGLLADLLWSDPQDTNTNSSTEWKQNDRGVSYCFNKSVVRNFCAKFNFDLIARGHMVVEQGYEFYSNRKLVTIFSAPNYCGEFKNWGAVMNVDKKLMCSFELLKPKELKK